MGNAEDVDDQSFLCDLRRLVLGVAGFVGAVQTVSFERSLALESGLAWLVVVAAVIVSW